MADEMRRYTITVTPASKADLERVRQECYFKKTQNEMIRDLISRGLASSKMDTDSLTVPGMGN